MEIRDLLKKAFKAGQDYGSNRTDKNFNDFLDQHKKQLLLCGVVGRSEQLVCDHPIEKRASFKSHGQDFCWKCGKHL